MERNKKPMASKRPQNGRCHKENLEEEEGRMKADLP
jgi:hypothetical protein